MTAQSDNFKRAWQFALLWEGGKLENVPGDKGGLTKYGVDQASHPHVNIRALTATDAAAIYHDNEWTKCRCDELPANLAVAVFDFAMTSGMGTAMRKLQESLGVTVDGFVGPRTLAEAKQGLALAQKIVLADYLDRRAQYLDKVVQADRSQRKFLSGWINRLVALRTLLLGTAASGGKAAAPAIKGSGAASGSVGLAAPLVLSALGFLAAGCAGFMERAVHPNEFRWAISQSYDERQRHAQATTNTFEFRWLLPTTPAAAMIAAAKPTPAPAVDAR